MKTYNNKNINDIFQSIKGSLAQDKQTGGTGDIMKLEVGNTYLVRLLPAKDPKKTFFHYFQHGWTSFSSGQYVSALSLQTFGERDPISEERYKLLKTGSDAMKAKANTIKRAEKWLVNVLVINDPVTPENNGKNKIVRYGKQLGAVITDAIEGDSSADFGSRVFDLSSNGVNLKIKIDKQGEFPTYVASKFSLPCEIKDMTEEKATKIYESVFELDKVFTVKNADQLKEMLTEHFYAEKETTDDSETPSIPVLPSKASKTTTSDEEVNKLLEGLDVN